AVLDLLPDVSLKQLQEDIRCRCTEYSSLPAEEALLGLLPAKVLRALILYIGKDPETKAAKFLPESDALGVAIKSLAFPVKELPDLTTGQICSGGFAPEELTETMEVKKLPGLFVTGEAVNVDGICGGYNLQWAFSTGAVAGRAAASKGFV
ncbi:MAG: NAD(P)/FAD-dependent oxidoreductase, partial [Lachnospiraceae bacterium]|nr:NAD(P)/FAD-dependent oxidoreductase [Lachnospiraceae bacterium]